MEWNWFSIFSLLCSTVRQQNILINVVVVVVVVVFCGWHWSQTNPETVRESESQNQSVPESTCPLVQAMHRQLFPLPTLPTNRAMMKAMDKVFDLYSVFVITCAAASVFFFSLFFSFFDGFFVPPGTLLCPFSTSFCLAHHCPCVRRGRTTPFCVNATNVCLRKPFRAF